MGSGKSVQLQEHLQRWDDLLNEMVAFSANNRRTIDQDRIHGDATRVSEREEDASEQDVRRHSSLVSFPLDVAVNMNGVSGTLPIDGTVGSNGPNRSRLTPSAMEAKAHGFGAANAGGATGTTGNPSKHNRQYSLEVKRARVKLFKSYEIDDAESLKDVMPCSHFGALAVGLSYLLGGSKDCSDRRQRVTVEDIFFAAQVPLHLLYSGPPHLPVMTDIVREFFDVDNRFKGVYSLETLHLDVLPTVGQVELGSNNVCDRQTRMQLPEFRRLITQDCEEETDAIRIVNYDPYVLEQEMLVDAYDDEDEINSPLATSVLGNSRQQQHQRIYTQKDLGAYAVIVDVRNAVQLMVTIAEGVVNNSLHVKLTEVPASSLFKAMMASKEGRRARGFIRLFKKDCVPEFTSDEIRLLWTPELCSGKVLGTTQLGTHALIVSHQISPHIAAVAWAMHLLGGVRPGTHGHGNGLPVSDIIRVMKFPSMVFLNGFLRLEQVYEYAVEYIKRTNRPYGANLFPVLTKISREDAVPTISIFDLESIIIDVKDANQDLEAPAYVMLIMYNAGVAHNVLNIAEGMQWCLLAGYDQETQTVLLIDAYPTTFSRTWTCLLDRLHMAMTGNGYMIFYKESARVSNRTVGAPREVAPTVQFCLQLLSQQHKPDFQNLTPIVDSFNFPSLPLMPTIIAMACCRLGWFTTFEDVIHTLPFDISSLLIRLFMLETVHVCLTQYLRFSGLDGDVQVTVRHGDLDADGQAQFSLQEFKSLIETSLEDGNNQVLIVDFDGSCIHVNGTSNPFGNLGIVVDMIAATGTVVVSDCNPNVYERTWSVHLSTLYNAIKDTPQTCKHRARGCLLVSRRQDQQCNFKPEQCADFKLELLPVQNAFHVSPSSHFQGLSFAFSQIGCFYSPEEIFYEAYLKTMNDQRRRGSQAFAWRDVEISLSVINKEVDVHLMVQVSRLFLKSRKFSAVAVNKGESDSTGDADIVVDAIDDLDIDDELDKLLREATHTKKAVLLLNYNILKAHGIANMGSSTALVRSYNPDKRLVELWNAEYAVFGLSFVVTVNQLIEIGELNSEGRSPYGFVRLSRYPSAVRLKRRPSLMKAPRTLEEEAEQEASTNHSQDIDK
ncbi:unnamed protein product [Phytomonas sp. Hart1]|nr:unnamed protein product [Phytomonas sp. Hart1]|eukprot:CCW66888.1 unnamed protein product [Phytomonas sp. isolate Hart1]